MGDCGTREAFAAIFLECRRIADEWNCAVCDPLLRSVVHDGLDGGEHQERLQLVEPLIGALDLEKPIPLIMSKSCELLNIVRYSLFLVDSVPHELVTCFAGDFESDPHSDYAGDHQHPGRLQRCAV
jgi:hypothetical protein